MKKAVISKVMTLLVFCSAMALMILVCPLDTFAAPPGSEFTLDWEDNFSGTALDTSEWDYRVGVTKDSYTQSQNVSLDGNGYLKIDLKQESVMGKNYTSGGVITKDTFRYGYFETRAKLTSSPGWHSSFWLCGNPAAGVSVVNEIDGFECVSHTPSTFTVCTHNYIPIWWNNIGASYSGVNTASDYHVYGFEWTPSYVYFYVDGTLIFTKKYGGPHALQNVWLTSIAEIWPDHGITAPTSITYDYFRHYSKNYSLNAPTGSIIVNNGGTGYSETGTWTTNNSAYGYSDNTTRSSNTSGGTATWTPSVSTAGWYNVYVWNPGWNPADRYDTGTNYTVNAKYTVTYSGGSATVHTNQAKAGQKWVNLGKYYFASGTGGSVRLTVQSGVTLADSIMLAPAGDIIVDNGGTGYTESGTWYNSGLTGYNGSSTRYTNVVGNYARWTPSIPMEGYYRVYIYKVVHSTSDNNALIEVGSKRNVHTTNIDYSTGTSGFVDLGVFYFEAGTTGYIKNTMNTAGRNGRADAVRLVPVGEYILDNGMTPEYYESGTWIDSGLTGNDLSTTRYSQTYGNYAQWNLSMPAGNYRVDFYNVAYTGDDTNAKIEIFNGSTTTTQYYNLDPGTTPKGWLNLGVFNFSGGTGYVKITLNTSGKKIRADAVRLLQE